MVRPKRDFTGELLNELKFHSKCRNDYAIRPEHFCTSKELSENLKMSLRDVGKTLHQMVSDKMLIHETVTVNHKQKHKFTPIDKRLFESKDLLRDMTNLIDNHFEQLRKIAKLMRDKPALKDVTMIPIIKDTTNIKKVMKVIDQARSSHGKIDKKGMDYQNRFCEIVNQIFSFIDSMIYATYDDSIESSEKNDKILTELRMKSVDEITDIITYIFRPLGARQSQAIYEQMIMKIPTYYMLMQIQRRSKIKIS